MRRAVWVMRIGRGFLGATVLAFAAPGVVGAMERPTPEQISQYRADGSLEGRTQRALQLGNHRVGPELVANATYRLRMDQWRKGLLDVQPTPPAAWKGMPTKGDVKVFALLISFSDYAPSNTQASIDSKLFGDGSAADFPLESLRNYYRRSSYDQLELQGVTLGWYNTGYPRSAVVDRETVIQEALSSFDAGHDFTQYDNDGDGAIDYFLVFWTGPDNGWGNFWWAYYTRFGDSSYRVDGKALRDYSWQWESPTAGATFSPDYAIHETGHALGLPDYYDYDPSVGPEGGLGRIDMMDATKGDHNCFSKLLLDWISPQIVSSGSTPVSLRPSGAAANAVLFAHGATGDPFAEYFMVQNRTRTANDTGLPGDGLLVWHVDARLDANGTEFEFDNSYTRHKLLRLMEADGKEEIERNLNAGPEDYYVGPSTITHWTRPSTARYDGSPTFMGVVDISAAGDPMTARIEEVFDATPPTGAPTTPMDDGVVTARDRVEFRWTAGDAADPNTGVAGYQIQVGTRPGAANVFDGVVGNVGVWGVDTIEEGHSYFARVRALNGAGVPSAWSGTSDGITVSWPAFPCEVLDNCGLVFKTSGDALWQPQGGLAEYGPTAARSGTIVNGQTSSLRALVTGPGDLSFQQALTGGTCCGELRVSVSQLSGAAAISAPGGPTPSWETGVVWVPPGPHVVTWTFSIVSPGGTGAGWIDHIEWTPDITKGGIAGTVTDAATTLGVSGAAVYVYSSAGWLVDWSLTDTYGRYASHTLAPGSYWALANNALGYLTELFDDVPCPNYRCSFADATRITVTGGTGTSGIDFALTKGGRIAGTLRDATTGAPVTGAYVEILDSTGRQVTGIWVDGGGGYLTDYLLPGTYYAMTGYADAYVDQLFGGIPCPNWSCNVTAGSPIVVTAESTTSGINFALARSGRISGAVTDASSGAPLGSVSVTIHRPDGVRVSWADTNSSGTYATDALPAGTYYARTSNSLGYFDEIYDNLPCVGPSCVPSNGTPIVVSSEGATTGVNFALARGGQISGAVTDAYSGLPLQSILVTVFDSSGTLVAYAYTNASGSFATAGLPGGTYYARTSNTLGYVDELFDKLPCAGSCTVAAGSPIVVAAGVTTAGIDFALTGSGRISGTVTDAASGAPVGSVWVDIYKSDDVRVGSGQTNASGVYATSGLPDGTYYARTSNALGYVNELFDNLPCAGSCTVTAGSSIVVAAGATTAGINFGLALGGRITGIVTDASSGAPLESVTVDIYNSSGRSVGGGTTNAAGTYTVSDLLAGTYYARSSNSLDYLDELFDSFPCLGGTCSPTDGTPIVLTSGGTATRIDFALAAGGRISGTVTDAASGAPLGTVRVYIYKPDGWYIGLGDTNAAGVYTTGVLPPGTYYACTSATSDYVDELFDNLPCPGSCTVTAGTPILVTPGVTVTGIDFALAVGGRISGVVTDASSDTPVASGDVSIYDSWGNYVGYGYPSASGVYTTTGLPTGTYYARTWNMPGYLNELFDNRPCSGYCSVTTGTPIVVTAGATTGGVDFALLQGGRISGRVTEASSGAPLQSIVVNVFDSTSTFVDSRSTNASGFYETTALPTGTYYAMTGYSDPYLDVLFDGIPCPSWNCTVTAGTPISVSAGSTTAGVDFALARPLSFFSVTPCRIVDTRDAARGGPLPLASGEHVFAVSGGACAIPASARAISVNVTVTQSDSIGHLRLHPAGGTLPQTSSINYLVGQTRANNALAGLSQSGELAVHVNQSSGSVHVIIDANGYFQ